MNWIKNNKKTILIFLFIAILLIFSRSYCFWIIFPATLSCLLFYSIKYYSKILMLVYPVIILATLFMLYAVGEFYLALSSPTYFTTTNFEFAKFFQPQPTITVEKENLQYPAHQAIEDPVTGYAPKPNSKEQIRKLYNDNVIFDAVYSVDSHGSRMTPDNRKTADTAIVLFGCSYTFGEGLNDEDTFAWKLGELLGSKYQIYNHAYNGWGSHQMLALLESDRLNYLQNIYKNIHIFYMTFEGIQKRSAGHSYWDTKGPLYIVSKNNDVRRIGTFEEYKNIEEQIQPRGKWKQSLLVARFVDIYNQIFARVEYAPEGVTLFEYAPEKLNALDSAIVIKATQVAQDKFPHTTFTVVLFKEMPLFHEILTTEGIDVLSFQDTFTGSDKEKYQIKYDTHPNALATSIIAEKYYNYILSLNAF